MTDFSPFAENGNSTCPSFISRSSHCVYGNSTIGGEFISGAANPWCLLLCITSKEMISHLLTRESLWAKSWFGYDKALSSNCLVISLIQEKWYMYHNPHPEEHKCHLQIWCILWGHFCSARLMFGIKNMFGTERRFSLLLIICVHCHSNSNLESWSAFWQNCNWIYSKFGTKYKVGELKTTLDSTQMIQRT